MLHNAFVNVFVNAFVDVYPGFFHIFALEFNSFLL